MDTASRQKEPRLAAAWTEDPTCSLVALELYWKKDSSACACVCAHVCAHVCMCMCLPVYSEARSRWQMSSSVAINLGFWDSVSQRPCCSGIQTGQTALEILLTPWCTCSELTDVHRHIWLLCESWGPKLRSTWLCGKNFSDRATPSLTQNNFCWAKPNPFNSLI